MPNFDRLYRSTAKAPAPADAAAEERAVKNSHQAATSAALRVSSACF